MQFMHLLIIATSAAWTLAASFSILESRVDSLAQRMQAASTNMLGWGQLPGLLTEANNTMTAVDETLAKGKLLPTIKAVSYEECKQIAAACIHMKAKSQTSLQTVMPSENASHPARSYLLQLLAMAEPGEKQGNNQWCTCSCCGGAWRPYSMYTWHQQEAQKGPQDDDVEFDETVRVGRKKRQKKNNDPPLLSPVGTSSSLQLVQQEPLAGPLPGQIIHQPESVPHMLLRLALRIADGVR
ncbi:hypothetical protein NP233_g12986 [Leucocoprinus birnbaumii]|uniref:Uncharacterized protein n=1 Tax=Leucocoprinus birnbaumii TaxID=56174 RepID=A0AAD5YJX8_9AGAR|nr:hypothetical protein NP233_g12986 [Leucocoprinus birnbaumii]